MSEIAKSKLLFLFIIPLLLYISSLHIMPLLDPDESRYSEIADSMVDTGDYITPRLNHVAYLEKPPLDYWVTAATFKIFGENEFSARLFPALCAWGCILLTFAMGSFLYEEKTGLYSAGVLSTFLYIYVLGHIDILDIPLTFFVCLAIWAGYRYIVENGQYKAWLYLLYVAGALAFLAKGMVGIIFPFAILAVWLLISRRAKDIFKLFSPVGLLILIAIISPWVFLVQKANQDFLWFFFVHEHFLRYTTKIHERYQSVLFYFPVVILGILPWAAYLVQALHAKIASGCSAVLNKTNKYFLVTWMVFVIIFFSFSSSKLVPYIAPIFPPIAVIFGRLFKEYDEQSWRPMIKMRDKLFHCLPIILQSLVFIVLFLLPYFIKNQTEFGGDLIIIHYNNWLWLIMAPIVIQILMVFLPDIIKQKFNYGWFLTAYMLSAFFLVSLIYPVSAFLTPYKSSYPLAQAVKAKLPVGEDIYQYKIFLYGIEAYTDIRTSVVDSFGEMSYGMQKLPEKEKSRYFLLQQEFFQLARGKKEGVYCITAKKENFAELKKEFPHLKVIWTNDVQYFMLLLH